MWTVKYLSIMVSANQVVTSGLMEGSGVVSAAGERRSVTEGILTDVIAQSGRKERKKERKYLFNKRIIQNKTTGTA